MPLAVCDVVAILDLKSDKRNVELAAAKRSTLYLWRNTTPQCRTLMTALRDCKAAQTTGIYTQYLVNSTRYSDHTAYTRVLISISMSTNGTQNLEQGNRAYAADFTQGDLALPPSQKYAVLTCMDARIDPAAAFGMLVLLQAWPCND